MRRMAPLTVLLLVAAACGGEGGKAVMDTSEPWDLVWFSDSSGFGVAELWAQRMEKDLGVEVRVNDLSAGNLAAKTVLDSIKNDSGLQELLAEAEIIVIQGNPRGLPVAVENETCVLASTAPRDPPTVYPAEEWEPYRDVLTSIYEAVFDLRGGEPTIVRAMDQYAPTIADWRAAGIEDECAANWETYNRTVREAAAEYGVPTASMFDAFNGPGHDKDPRDKGFIGPDKIHTSDEGKAAQVEVLHALGYDPVGR